LDFDLSVWVAGIGRSLLPSRVAAGATLDVQADRVKAGFALRISDLDVGQDGGHSRRNSAHLVDGRNGRGCTDADVGSRSEEVGATGLQLSPITAVWCSPRGPVLNVKS